MSRTPNAAAPVDGQGTAPVFLVGAERSGSTLLSHMLDHHPQLSWSLGFEPAVIYLDADGRPPPLAEYYRSLEVDRPFQTLGYHIDPSLSYPALLRDFLQQERDADGKALVGATVHLHFDRVRRFFPACRFIHLVRDGRDVSRSCIGMGWAGNGWYAAQRWLDAERLWDRVRAALRPEDFCEVRYEALIATPHAELERLCAFIGIPYSPAMLRYPEDTAYRPPQMEWIGQWRRLSARDIQLIESRLGILLEARGYPPSGLPPRAPGWSERQWLREQDRYRRVAFRVRRNGWRLVAADFLARQLHLTAWARRLRQRINAIEAQHLQ